MVDKSIPASSAAPGRSEERRRTWAGLFPLLVSFIVVGSCSGACGALSGDNGSYSVTNLDPWPLWIARFLVLCIAGVALFHAHARREQEPERSVGIAFAVLFVVSFAFNGTTHNGHCYSSPCNGEQVTYARGWPFGLTMTVLSEHD